MNIKIERCNNIDEGNIIIVENCINIKYGINGIGKTTIAKAIENSIKDRNESTQSMMDLKPFKYRDTLENNPKITGLEDVDSIYVFNEDYVNQYVFLPDELLKNSFEIFIHDNQYDVGIKEINTLIKSIAETFEDNDELDILLNNLNELGGCFGTARGIAKSSSFYKGIGIGNKVTNIPKGLEDYKDYIQHKENVKWLKWQMTGCDFLDISSSCPYCTTEIEEKKQMILTVKEEFDSKLIQHLNKVIDVVERLSSYFNVETYKKIIAITKSITGYKKEHESFLLEIREQISILQTKLINVKALNFGVLKDFDKVIEEINKYKVDLSYLSHLNSEETSSKINIINKTLDEILIKAGELQGKVNQQKKHIEKTIKEYNSEINDFLKYAGYSYQVDIIEKENQSYKMILKHNDFQSNDIDNPKIHLSFGERNAFALVLFMFESIKNNPDIIVLDDPISSFDKNKKFAIINMLFRGRKSLRGKTVIMLMHDFEPVVDMIKHLPHLFEPIPKAYFLECVNGILNEKEILKTDIKTFVEIAKENIEVLDEDINKLIYLRRLYELNNEKGLAFQLLSNIFHKREVPKYLTNGIDRVMEPNEITIATDEIKNTIPTFDYNECIVKITDEINLKRLFTDSSNNYEKLQLYRLITIGNSENKIIMKFVNEIFHIENDYMYQLNPYKYQIIPHYIIEECANNLIS